MSLAVVPSGPQPGGPDPGGEGPRGNTPAAGLHLVGEAPGMATPASPRLDEATGAAGSDDPEPRRLGRPELDAHDYAPDEMEPREIRPNPYGDTQKLVPVARPTMEVFRAIFHALDAHSRPVIGPAERELFAIPLHDHDGTVTGGIWASTLFRWLNVELLFVPEDLRGRGVGSALLAAAETEAMRRDCLGAFVDTASFQAPGFYQRLGYTLYGRLGDFPPGHERLYFRKLFGTGA